MWGKRYQSVKDNEVGGNLTVIMGGEPAATDLERAADRLRKDVLSRASVWLPATLHGRSIRGWSGTIKADGCAGGAVKVTLALAGEVPVTFTLRDSADSPMKDLSEPARPKRRPVSLTLRRLDDRPCSLLVEWSGPGLVDDGLEPARKRLGVTASTMTHSAFAE